MIAISERKVIENSLFRTKLTFNKSSIFPYLSKIFSEDNSFNILCIEKIGNKEGRLAHNIILNKDLERIKGTISDEDAIFDEKVWIERLPEIKNKIENHLGLSFNSRKMHFVESFPEDYKNYEIRGASTITVFEGNEMAGIYFLKKRVDRTSTPIHVIHEQIHTCLSQNKDKDQMFIEWFEEGTAILLSLLIYYEITNDFETLNAYRERSWIYSKTAPEWDFTKRYFEYMKIVSRIFRCGGMDLIKKIMKDYLSKNREKVNEYIENIQNNTLPTQYMPKDKIEEFIVNYSDIIEPESITPLEFLIVKSMTKPISIEDISKIVEAPIDVVKKTLSNLYGKGMCFPKGNLIDVNWRKKDLLDRDLIKPFLMM